MARLVFLFLIFTLVLVGLAQGRPKKRSSTSNGKRGGQGFATMKTQLQNALNENSATAILSVLRSLPSLKGSICSSTSQPPVSPTTQAANTMANEQDFGWLFDLVSTALSQPTAQKMKIVLKSNPKLRRKLCGTGPSIRPSTRPTSPSTPTRPTTPPPPPPVVATNPKVRTAAAGVSSFVDVALRDEGNSGNRATPTRPNAPTRPAAASGQPATPTHPRATEQAPADALNDDYSDEFLSIPAMRKRRSLESNGVQVAEKNDPPNPRDEETPDVREIVSASNDRVEGGEIDPFEEEGPLEVGPRGNDREFHVATVIPPTVFPAEDAHAAVPRVKISASNLLEDGQFDESITIYPDSHDQAVAMDLKEQEQKKEEPLPDKKTLPSNAKTLSQQAENNPQQGDETTPQVSRSKKEETKTVPLDEDLKVNDVLVSKKEMFSADEMPEQLSSVAEEREKKDVQNNDDQLAMTESKRNIELPVEPSQIMSNDLDELKQEDWETKKAPEGGEIKYEVDDEPSETLTKRKAKNKLRMKLGKLRKKNIFA